MGIVIIYSLISFGLSIGMLFAQGLTSGLIFMLISTLSTLAGGGLRAVLFWNSFGKWGSQGDRIGGVIFASALITLAQYLSPDFSLHFLGYSISISAWSWIGFILCFCFLGMYPPLEGQKT